MTREGATNTEVFQSYAPEIIVPSLRQGDNRHHGQLRLSV